MAEHSFELLAGNRLLGHRRDLEGSERRRVVAADNRHAGTYGLVFVVFSRQYFIFCHDHCHNVLYLAQFTEALKLKAVVFQ
jgi:hypothetical protein